MIWTVPAPAVAQHAAKRSRRCDIGRRRCCCGECIIIYDDFDREDTTDLGPKWNETAGDWEIIDAHLVPVSGTPATVITTSKNNRSKRGVLEGNFRLTGEGPWEIDFALNATPDGSFSQSVTFEATETECTLYAGSVQKGFDDDDVDGKKPTSWVFPGATAGLYFFRACLTDGLLHLWITGAENETNSFSACVWDIHVDPSPSGGGYAGITRVDGDMEFDWVRYAHHDADGFDDPFCPDCSCICDNGTSKAYVPFRLHFDILDEAEGCTGVDGSHMRFEPVACGPEAGVLAQYVCVESTLPGEGRNWQAVGALGAAKLDCGYEAFAQTWFAITGINIGTADILGAKTVNCKPFLCEYEWSSSPEGDELCDPNVTLTAELTEWAA